jgi:hypothetical protein
MLTAADAWAVFSETATRRRRKSPQAESADGVGGRRRLASRGAVWAMNFQAEMIKALKKWNLVLKNAFSNGILAGLNQILAEFSRILAELNQVLADSNEILADSRQVLVDLNQILPGFSHVLAG